MLLWRTRAAAAAGAVALVVVGVFVERAINDGEPMPVKIVEETAAADLLRDEGCAESVTGGWWPDRETFTLEQPAGYPTLNSITDNPNEGDERSFFDVKPMTDDESGGFCNTVHATDGDVLLLRAYVENSAADNLVDPETRTGEGLAENVQWTVRAEEERATLVKVVAELRSSTTRPKVIGDSVEITSDRPFRLDMVHGSATAYSNFFPEGLPLGGDLAAGVTVGSLALDGNVPPGYDYSLILTVEARVTAVS